MKIGIITFHFASNQGAALQCYALQTYLERRGHEAFVIDYRPAYHTAKYAAVKNPFVIGRTNWRKNAKKPFGKRLVSFFRGAARAVVASAKKTDKRRAELFSDFAKQYLHLSGKYTSLSALQKNPPQADAYVSGSDQLWNPDFLDNRFDAAYFLCFGDKDVKKLTYAVSLKEHYTDAEKEELKKLSADIDGLCIREENEDFERTVNRAVSVCIDPTLLVDAAAFAPAEEKRLVPEPYLFVYGLENSEALDEAVKTIATELKLKVINGTPHRTRLTMPCTKTFNYGPRQFLSYVKHADYVVTNSFHGTAFSVIYKRRFSVIAHTTRGKRMTELLTKLGLRDRIYGGAPDAWKQEIDYDAAYEKLSRLRKVTDTYFENNL